MKVHTSNLASVSGHMREGIAAEFKLAVTWSVTLDTDAAEAIIRAAQMGEKRRYVMVSIM